MSIKCSGAEFIQFFNDEEYWGTNWVDDDYVTKNKEEYDTSFGSENIVATDAICIESGVVYTQSNVEVSSYVSFFRKWKQKQTHETLIVSVPKDKLAVFREFLKANSIKETKT